jgi:ribokinase
MDAFLSSPAMSTPLVQARRARVLTATSRELEILRRGAVELDALVGSGEDRAEHYGGDLEPAPRLVVTTSGALGGWARPGGPFSAATPPGEVIDTYGAGDSFAAGLTYCPRRRSRRGRCDRVRRALRRGRADWQGRRAPARRRPLTGVRGSDRTRVRVASRRGQTALAKWGPVA